MKNLILILLSATLSISVTAQTEVFKVIGNKGLNQAKTKTGTTKALLPGTKLYAGESIVVMANGYVSLVHSTGKTLELTKPGTYTVDNLSKTVTKTGSTTDQKYGQFVYGQLTAQNVDVNDQYKQHQTTTGAVNRRVRSYGITVAAPAEFNVLSEQTTYHWAKNPKISEYKVVITDTMGKKLDSVITQDTTFTLNMKKYADMGAPVVKWTLVSNDASQITSNNFTTSWVPSEEMSGTAKVLQNNASQKTATAADLYLVAMFFDNNNYFWEAREAYLKMLNKAPGIDSYMEAYKIFMERNGLTAKTK